MIDDDDNNDDKSYRMPYQGRSIDMKGFLKKKKKRGTNQQREKKKKNNGQNPASLPPARSRHHQPYQTKPNQFPSGRRRRKHNKKDIFASYRFNQSVP